MVGGSSRLWYCNARLCLLLIISHPVQRFNRSDSIINSEYSDNSVKFLHVNFGFCVATPNVFFLSSKHASKLNCFV